MLLVYPTEKALDIKDRIYRCYRDWSSYLTQDFTDEEQELLSQLMIRISQRAEAYVKGGDCICERSDNT